MEKINYFGRKPTNDKRRQPSPSPPPPPTYKREVPDSAEQAPSAKRGRHGGSTLTFDNGMALQRRTAQGVRIPIEETFAVLAGDAGIEDHTEEPAEAGMDGSEYEDVKEEIDAKEDKYEGEQSDAGGEAEEEEELVDEEGESEAEMVDAGDDESEQYGGAEDYDPDDLFQQMMRNRSQSQPPADHDDGYDDPDSDGEVITITHTRSDPATTDEEQDKAKHRALHPDYIEDLTASEHNPGCKTSRSASTPPPSPKASQPSHKEPDLVKDIRKSLQQWRKFHTHVKTLIPRLPLAPHRYWIAVLHLGKKTRDAKTEKHFTWMKGNRLTTISTIWHTYATTTVSSDFVLMHGFERLEMSDRCEEVDYFGDRFILLRAVDEGSKEAAGRELAAGCPIEVVEIED